MLRGGGGGGEYRERGGTRGTMDSPEEEWVRGKTP